MSASKIDLGRTDEPASLSDGDRNMALVATVGVDASPQPALALGLDPTLVGSPSDPTTGRSSPAAAASQSELDRGAAVGRYIVLARLGAGGMGVVYAAYDPELDRKVAIKLLHAAPSGRRVDVSAAQTRLLREAQALAKLTHPNVVTVHDVGTIGEQVWVAMEFIEGDTLDAWIGPTRRLEEVLRALLDAGRGVAAAHTVGLVHRDLKPENIMVGADGRVRVMDFGLAALRRLDEPTVKGDDAAPVPGNDALSVHLTQAGAVMGTPAFMAPEQFRGVEVDAKADQFSFCVTAWESFFGQRPFAGDSLARLAANVLAGTILPPPRGSRVPAWIRRALTRGLQPKAGDRWPSLTSLLKELEAGRRRVRTRRVIALCTVGALVIGGGIGLRSWDRSRTIAGCTEAGLEIERVWNETSRTGLRDGILAVEKSYAEDTATGVLSRIDTYAETWGDARRETCLDGQLRGAWTEDTVDRSRWCLDARLSEVRALVEELSAADEHGLTRATTAAANLNPVDSCRDARLLHLLPAPPSVEVRDEIFRVVDDLSRASSLRHAGRKEQGLAAAQSAMLAAEKLDWPPLVAEARLVVGVSHETLGAYAEAAQTDEKAYFEAREAGQVELAIRTAIKLAHITGYRLGEPDVGAHWLRLADVELREIATPEHPQWASFLEARSLLHFVEGEYAEAIADIQEAIVRLKRANGPIHPDVGVAMNLLAIYYTRQEGTGEEGTLRAIDILKRALVITEESFGAKHPKTAAVLLNLANGYAELEEHEEAVRLQRRCLEVVEAVHGREHPSTADVLNNLGNSLHALKDFSGALELHLEVQAIRAATLKPGHADLASSQSNLAEVYRGLGELEKAEEHIRSALGMLAKLPRHHHPEMIEGLGDLASHHQQAGEHELAAELLAGALQVHAASSLSVALKVELLVADAMVALGVGDLERSDARLVEARGALSGAEGAEHRRASARVELAEAEVALQRRLFAEAIAHAESALASVSETDKASVTVIRARFILARALWEAPAGERDRVRARSLQGLVIADLGEAIPGEDVRLHGLRTDVEAWSTGRR